MAPRRTTTWHGRRASALIAYVPALAGWRIPLALGLTVPAAGLTWFGHLGRTLLAVMTPAFVAITVAVLASGIDAPVHPSGTITLGLTAEAVRLHIGIPAANSTQIADLASGAANPTLYGLFQLVTALLLLSAASSSFQAGPGLLKALVRQHGQATDTGILPKLWGRTNRHHTPY